ncbi:MAG: hypothetical protein RLZZ142_2696 [Verrucomicrobiota bacterium]
MGPRDLQNLVRESAGSCAEEIVEVVEKEGAQGRCVFFLSGDGGELGLDFLDEPAGLRRVSGEFSQQTGFAPDGFQILLLQHEGWDPELFEPLDQLRGSDARGDDQIGPKFEDVFEVWLSGVSDFGEGLCLRGAGTEGGGCNHVFATGDAKKGFRNTGCERNDALGGGRENEGASRGVLWNDDRVGGTMRFGVRVGNERRGGGVCRSGERVGAGRGCCGAGRRCCLGEPHWLGVDGGDEDAGGG